MEIEDRKLVAQVLAGQSDEFRVLVERHQQSIFRFAFGMLGPREEAQDITQETFLAAFVNLSRFDSAPASFSTWLFTIARNRCINLLKRRRNSEDHDLELVADVAMADPVLGEELSQQLDRALASLPVDQRSTFVLAEIEDLPYAEIAQIEQTTLGTVKSRIHRAKTRLRSLLEHELGESK